MREFHFTLKFTKLIDAKSHTIKNLCSNLKREHSTTTEKVLIVNGNSRICWKRKKICAVLWMLLAWANMRDIPWISIPFQQSSVNRLYCLRVACWMSWCRWFRFGRLLECTVLAHCNNNSHTPHLNVSHHIFLRISKNNQINSTHKSAQNNNNNSSSSHS